LGPRSPPPATHAICPRPRRLGVWPAKTAGAPKWPTRPVGAPGWWARRGQRRQLPTRHSCQTAKFSLQKKKKKSDENSLDMGLTFQFSSQIPFITWPDTERLVSFYWETFLVHFAESIEQKSTAAGGSLFLLQTRIRCPTVA